MIPWMRRRSARLGAAVTVDTMGARLFHRHKMLEDGDARITVAGAEVDTLHDFREPTPLTPVYTPISESVNRGNYFPDYVGTHNAFHMPSTTDHLDAAVAVGAGGVGMWVICDVDPSAGTRYQASLIGATGRLSLYSNTIGYSALCTFQTTGQVSVTAGSPTPSAQVRLFAIRAKASGAVFEIDGAPTTPNFSVEEPPIAFTTFSWGEEVNHSRGYILETFVAEPDDDINDAIKAYASDTYGLTIS